MMLAYDVSISLFDEHLCVKKPEIRHFLFTQYMRKAPLRVSETSRNPPDVRSLPGLHYFRGLAFALEVTRAPSRHLGALGTTLPRVLGGAEPMKYQVKSVSVRADDVGAGLLFSSREDILIASAPPAQSRERGVRVEVTREGRRERRRCLPRTEAGPRDPAAKAWVPASSPCDSSPQVLMAAAAPLGPTQVGAFPRHPSLNPGSSNDGLLGFLQPRPVSRQRGSPARGWSCSRRQDDGMRRGVRGRAPAVQRLGGATQPERPENSGFLVSEKIREFEKQ